MPHSFYDDLEFSIETLCALANRTRSAPVSLSKLPPIADLLHTDRYRLRLKFFHSLYCPASPPTNLLGLDPPDAALMRSPHPESEKLWAKIIELFPEKDKTISALLRSHAEDLLRSAARPEYYPTIMCYKKARWTHEFPDPRSLALIHAHYILLLEFCAHFCSSGSGKIGIFVQATVHPSERSHLLHFPRISFDRLPDANKPFRLSSAICSCEDGYAGCSHFAETYDFTV
jgi:hypothetical protein